MIFHNMQEIVREIAQNQVWMNVKKFFHYEELLEAGISQKEYEALLEKEQVSSICYLVSEKKDLHAVFKQMEDLTEIYSAVPIRIAIESEDYSVEDIPLRYRWIKGIEIANFSKESRKETLDWLIRDQSIYLSIPTIRFDTDFYMKNEIYRSFIKSMKWERPHFYENLYLGGLFRALLLAKELYYSVMLEYDFVEFMLSMVHYYYKAKAGEEIQEGRKILEYKEHAVEILRLSKDTSLGNRLRQEKIHINFELSSLNDTIEKCYGILVVGDEYNFLGLVDILQKIRNRTRGHGVIVGKSGMALWDILFRYSLLLIHFLDMEDFFTVVREGKVYAGYRKQEMICLSPFVIDQNDVPCILHQIKGKNKKEYINYFYGEYAVPDFG